MTDLDAPPGGVMAGGLGEGAAVAAIPSPTAPTGRRRSRSLASRVVPPFLAMALAIILMISARVKTAAAAQQASQLVTLPVILLAYGVATGLLFNAVTAAVVIGG